jgi:hypothetical protein
MGKIRKKSGERRLLAAKGPLIQRSTKELSDGSSAKRA